MMSQYDLVLKVLLLGDNKVGKTTLLRSFRRKNLGNCSGIRRPAAVRTIITLDSEMTRIQRNILIKGTNAEGKTAVLSSIAGQNIKAKHVTNVSALSHTALILRGQKIVQITVVDTGGQEKFRSLTASYYRGAHGCLLLFDVTKENTFKNIAYWLHDLKEYSSKPELCTILVGTKCHVPAAAREVTTECAQKYAESVDLPYMEVSAEDGTNVTKVFENLADIIIKKITKSQTAMTLHTHKVILEAEKLKKKQHWCSC